jgi:hypothetical protein
MYQRFHSSRLTRAILVLIVLQLGVVVLYGRAQVASQPESLPPLDARAHDVGQPSGLESLAAVARTRATVWRSDAGLMTASLQIDWPLDAGQGNAAEIPAGGWASFAFYSDSPDGAVLSILMERTSGAIMHETLVPWPGEALRPTMLVLDGAATDSLTALMAAELSAGRAYRLACPDRRHATYVSLTWSDISRELAPDSTPDRTGARPTPLADATAAPMTRPSLVWVVSYEDSVQPGRYPLRVAVADRTGSVIAVRGSNDGCDAAAEG